MLTVLIVVLGGFIGYLRGAGRSVVRLTYLAVIAALSVLAAKALASPVAGAIMGAVRGKYNESIIRLTEKSPGIETEIQSLLSALLFPFIFALIFGLLELLTLIKLKALSKKLVSLVRVGGDPENTTSKLIGAGVGFAVALLVSAVLLLPMATGITILRSTDSAALAHLGVPGYSVNGDSNLNTTDDLAPKYAALAAEPLQIYSLAREIAEYKTDYFFSAGIFRGMMLIDGTGTSALDEIPLLLDAAGYVIDDYRKSVGSGDASSKAMLGAVTQILPYMERSVLLPRLTSLLLSGTAKIWLDGDSFMGVTIDMSHPITGKLIRSFLVSLSNATPQNTPGLLYTMFAEIAGGKPSVISGLLEITNDKEALKSKENINNIADMLIAVGKNEDLSLVIQTVGEIGTTIIKDAGIKTIPKDNPQAYESIKDKLITTIQDGTELEYEEQVLSLADSIESIADNYDKEVSEGEAKVLAVGLIAYFGSTDEITTEGLMEYFGVTTDDIITSSP